MARKKSEKIPEEDKDSDEIVSGLIKTLNKSKRSAYSFLEREDPSQIKRWISTGSTLLDYIISNRHNGGIPYGRVTEIHGQESTGKSLLAFHIIANAQKQGGVGVYLDTEGRMLEKDFLLRLGINPRAIVIDSPASIEECFETIESTIVSVRKSEKNKDRPLVIVWDSLGNTPPEAELEGNFDPQSQIGLGAKAVKRGVRKLRQVIGTESVALVVINQLNYNIKAQAFQDPYITPYGKAIPYIASVRIRISHGAKIKGPDSELVGNIATAKIIKNSLGPPGRDVNFPLMFGYGVDEKQSIYDYLNKIDFLKRVAGTSRFKLGGQDYQIPHDEWKSFYDKHKSDIQDVLAQNLIRTYDDLNPENDIEMTLDEEDLTAEV